MVLASCSNKNDGIDPEVKEYFDDTKGYSLDRWESDQAWSIYGWSFIANIIPGLHLVGVWVDTAVVIYGVEDLAMGNGAIIAKEKSCLHLVSKYDYAIIQGMWVGAISDRRVRSALKSARQAQILSRSGTRAATQAAANRLMKVVSEKVGLKLTSKLAFKFGIKIAAIKVLGFVPLLGGIAAVFINKVMFVDPIDRASELYYSIKAREVCG